MTLGVVDNLESNEKNNLLIPAILVFLIVRVTLILLIHGLFQQRILTAALTLMLICETIVKIGCALSSVYNGRYLRHVSDIISDFFLTEFSVFKRILIYISLYASVYMTGILFIFIGVIFDSKFLVWGGGLATIISIIKLLPIYPTEGGINAKELAKGTSCFARILIECSGYLILSLVWSVIFGSSIGIIIMLPVLLLPFRIESIKMKYKVIQRIEKAILRSDIPLNRKEIYAMIYTSPELKKFPVSSSFNTDSDQESTRKLPATRESIAENMLFEVMMKPLNKEQRVKLSTLLIVVLSLELFLSGLLFSAVSGVGINKIDEALVAGNCDKALELREVYSPYILTGRNAGYLAKKGPVDMCSKDFRDSKEDGIINEDNQKRENIDLKNRSRYIEFV